MAKVNEAEKAKMNTIRIAVSETAPTIKKIEMVDGGMSGLKVTYFTTEIRNSVCSGVDMVKKQKRPVQRELREYFEALREHLLSGCGYYWNNETTRTMLVESAHVNYVQTEDGKFQIGGKKAVGDYTIALNTALMANEDYDKYEEMKDEETGLGDILSKIVAEAKAFMSGTKGADSRQVAVAYMVTQKALPDAENEWEKMTADERKAMENEAFGFYGLEVVEEDGEMVLGAKEEKTVSDETQKVTKERTPKMGDKEKVNDTPNLSQLEEVAVPGDEEDFDLPTR